MSTSVGTSTGWVPDAVGAMYGLGATYDYYLQRHGRNSLDDAGSSIRDGKTLVYDAYSVFPTLDRNNLLGMDHLFPRFGDNQYHCFGHAGWRI